jgi:uncharacterized protein DUF4388
MSLIGDLSDTSIADVLRVFASTKKTGRLTVSSEEEQTVLHFHAGALVHARGAGSRLQGEDVVLDLFGWTAGQMTFTPDEKTVMPNVTRGVDQLIVDGLRLGGLFHRTQQLIPSDHVVFQLGPGPQEDAARYPIGAMEWRVLRHVDGTRDVREILEAAGLARAEVLRILVELTDAGFIEKVEPRRELRVQAQGLFAKDVVEMDDRLDGEWRRLQRFARGVQRVEVRSSGGRSVTLAVRFRGGVGRGVFLPRTAVTELQVKEGDDVQVRPVG